jgi:hypothetical protein
MLPPIYNLLRASSDVVALLGDRIYRHGSAPKGVREPYLTWFQVVGVPENTLSETPAVDRSTVQLDIWCGGSDGDSRCEELAEVVRDTLEPDAHCTSTPIDQRDNETKLWRIALEFDFFVMRTA